MIFSDARFIMLFFPAVLLFVALLRLTGNWMVVALGLITVSVAFYMQWNPADLAVVACSVTLNFAIANIPGLSRRFRLWSCVGLNVGYLFFLKYVVAAGWFTPLTTGAGNLFGTLGLPLGISFITFQQIGFVVDQAEGRDREPNPIRYLFFVLFFPHLVAGPLVPHRLLCSQLDRKPFLRPSATFLRVGLAYFAIGLVKKLAVAEPLNVINNELFRSTAHLSMVEAWFNVFVYSFRIYYDFSAYSDMATGLAYLLGIQFPRNFTSPYKATNVFEFWRNWHITLYKFFRRYLYIRLVRQDFFRNRAPAAMLIVMLLSAMWHGVGWGYILWGLGHAAAMIATRFAVKRGWISAAGPVSRLDRFAAVAGTFFIVTVLWIPFAVTDLHSLGLFGGRLVSLTQGSAHMQASWVWMLLATAVLTFAAPNSHQICLTQRHAAWLLGFGMVLGCLALPLAVGRLAPAPPFIYFQF